MRDVQLPSVVPGSPYVSAQSLRPGMSDSSSVFAASDVVLDAPLHLDLGKLLLGCAVASVGYVGCYLYGLGFGDLKRGLKANGGPGTCATYGYWELLSVIAPFFCMARILLAPAVWSRLAVRRHRCMAFTDPFVIVWLVLFLWPVLMLTWAVLAGWLGDMSDSGTTIETWSADCPVKRPVHALFQTRCGALGGSFLSEIIWYVAIAWFGYEREFFGRLDPRGGSVGYIGTVALYYLFMLLAGPMRYQGEPIVDPAAAAACRDDWIITTYIVVTVLGFLAKLLLFFMPGMLSKAIEFKHTSLGPYGHISTWLWWAVHLLQLFTCIYCMRNAQDLKVAPPFQACGRDYAEFFVPRFFGLMYFLYAEFLMFNFWLLGATFSSGEPVFMMRVPAL